MEEEKKRPSWEEIVERRISMAKERGSRVMKINSPVGSIMFNVLRQFDQAYAHFKGQLGELGGISHEEGAKLMEEAREITLTFSDFTGKLSKRIRLRYFVPQELRNIQDKASVDRTEDTQNTN